MLAYFFGLYHGQVWPNLIADAATLGVGFLWAHRKIAARLDKHHEAITAAHSELTDLVSSLHARMDAEARRPR